MSCYKHHKAGLSRNSLTSFGINVIFIVWASLCLSCKKESKSDVNHLVDDPKVEQPANKTESPTEDVVPIDETPESNELDYDLLSESISGDIQVLDTIYSYTPFYGLIDGERFFLTRNHRYEYGQDWFTHDVSYGLVNFNFEELLPLDYSKIGNPNLLIQDCFEICRNGKYGLYNYRSGEILEPQFDYIFPAKTSSESSAFGLKNGKVFGINSKSTFQLELIETGFPLNELLLHFDIDDHREKLLFRSYNERLEYEPRLGSGVIVMPSYIAELGIFGLPIIDNIILSGDRYIDFGTEKVKTSIKKEKTLLNKLTSFFVSIYRSGVEARDYAVDERRLLVLNSSTNSFSSSELGSISESDYLCRESDYKIVNDSIVEVKLNKYKGNFYDFETQYSYKKIQKNGSAEALNSNRIFDFTKYVIIDESYFGGCFAKFMENLRDLDENNIWLSDHLTIRELDIMRNEIFAEYGYRFQTKEWQDYFSTKGWYTPLYDDVNHLLTEIDKSNIKTILEMKRRMEGNEEKYVNKRASVYVAAG